MVEFKIGDKFIPHKPEIIGTLSWPSELDKFEGKTLTVSGISYFYNLEVKETEFVFDPDWCEKVDQSVEANEKVEEHTPETIKTIDWEQRRYEIAKEFMAAQISGVISADISWYDLAMVKYAVNAADELIKQLQKSSENEDNSRKKE